MYTAPLDDMQFLIDDVIDVSRTLGSLQRFVEVGVGPELTTAVLDEAGKLGSDVVAPLRRVGDAHPARCEDGKVSIPPGYGEAIRELGAGGWVGISADADAGGQGLPEIYGTAASEICSCRTSALSTSAVPIRCPETLSTSSTRPVIRR